MVPSAARSMPTGAAASEPTFRLRGPAAPARLLTPTSEQWAVIDNRERRLRVLAGPGTGKTATLVETVARRIEQGIDPAHLLVVTFSRRAANELAQRIAARIRVTAREPIVRTLHSYAYQLVRGRAARQGDAPPRLLGAGESDHVVRELLLGHHAAGGSDWPVDLRAALTSPAFGQELRELLLRAAEADLTPDRMLTLSRRHHRPVWAAVARFAREYQQVADLRQASTGLGAALDQAELTQAALSALADDAILRAEQERIRRIYVDEYQDVDPAQSTLVQRLASGADELIVVGDPDQSIYAFRGSDPGALRRIEVDRTVTLGVTRRLSPSVVVASRRVCALLPGPGEHRQLTAPARSADPAQPGSGAAALAADEVSVQVFSSAGREAAYIADRLRRAHLLEGVPWSRMAVLVRSPPASVPALARAFGSAGVPLSVSRADQPLLADPLVASMLELIRCGRQPGRLSGRTALDLLASPLAGLDPGALRTLRRAVRAGRGQQVSSADQVAAVLAGAGAGAGSVPTDLAEPVGRLRELLALARPGRTPETAESTLWRIWEHTGLGPTLAGLAQVGGRTGQRADRTLDAVMALFSTAADLAVRLPLAGLDALVELVEGQSLPVTDQDGATGRAEVVGLLSAHSAKGLEWDVVVVAGVQEGGWPDLRARDSLLHSSRLLDLAAGMPESVDHGAVSLAEERRLFYVAVTRARRTLICTAVSGEQSIPSRFLSELTGTNGEGLAPTVVDHGIRRGLHLTALVADLRRAVSDPEQPALAREAAGHLARLASLGVRGADPGQWWGLAHMSTDRPPQPPGGAIRISPSAVETLLICPLRVALDRRAGGRPLTEPQLEGIVLHALAQGLGLGLGAPELTSELTNFIDEHTQTPLWQRRRIVRVLGAMVEAARGWVIEHHPPRMPVGTEIDIDVLLPPSPDESSVPADAPPVRLAGRVDWLARDPDGALVVSDFKTAASTPSKAGAAVHPQLAAYQIATAWGAFDEQPAGPVDGRPDLPDLPERPARGSSGGAELVFLRGGTAKVFPQPPFDATDVRRWTDVIRSAATDGAGGRQRAVDNEKCERCPVRLSCPLHGGRQVTR